MKRRAKAFTLLEVTVVVLILALVSAAATLHVRGRMESANLQDVVGQVRSFDRLTRSFSREQDRALRVMVSSGRLRRVDESGLKDIGTALELPEGFAVAEVRVAGKLPANADTVVGCSRLGLTPSYAVKIAARSGAARWVLFAGLSGEAREIEDEREVQDILSAARNDAD